MLEFSYVIKDQEGIHARPAGMLVKEAQKFECAIKITKDEKTVDLKRLFALMGLGVKCGQEVSISFDGTDEQTAYDTVKTFIEANL